MFRGQYVGATKSGSFRRGQNLAHDVLKRDSKRQSRLLNDQGEGDVTRQLKMVHLEGPRQLKLGQLMAQFVHITLSRFNLFLCHIFLGFLASPARAFNIKCLAVVDDSIDRGSGRYGIKEHLIPFRVG